jgi:hypothetical protein
VAGAYREYLDKVELHAALEDIFLVAIPVLEKRLIHAICAFALLVCADLKLDLVVLGAWGAVDDMMGEWRHRVLTIGGREVDAAAVDVDAEVAHEHAEELGLMRVEVRGGLLAARNQLGVDAQPRSHETMERELAIQRVGLVRHLDGAAKSATVRQPYEKSVQSRLLHAVNRTRT